MNTSPLRKAVISGIFSLTAAFLCASPAPEKDAKPAFNVFRMPGLHRYQAGLAAQFKSVLADADYISMKDICLKALEIFPEDPTWHYNLACSFSRLGYYDEALTELETAVALGFSDTALLSGDRDISTLRGKARFGEILQKADDFFNHPEKNPAVKKPAAIGNEAVVSKDNTVWDMENGGFTATFSAPADKDAAGARDLLLPGPAGDLIRKWIEEGTAAGNAGDFYENRDNRHSVFELEKFPGFREIKFSSDAVQAYANVGVSFFSYGGLPVLGNSSTALLDPDNWRSNARLAQHEYPHMMFAQYMNNQMYVYPQHEDYRPNKHGDVFTMRTPYSYIAPGSSWTDRPIMSAIAAAMAALRPETKRMLIEKRLLAPTLQYIIRSSLKTVAKREDYLTPLAHPVVFDGKDIDTVKMAELAHSITTNCLPPFATFLPKYGLKKYRRNVDYFDTAESELQLVSPCASAFVWRGMDYSRHFTLDASASKDPAGNPLKFHWFIGQGMESKIRISPENADSSVVRVDIDYHDPLFESPYKIKTSRVDIILAVDNGTHYSPPAFFSYYFPPNEKRTYFSDKTISAVDYASCATNYADPKISVPKFWCDFYTHNERGRLTGWTRMRKDSPTASYTKGGMRITATDKDGNFTKVVSPRYELAAPARNFKGEYEYIESER